eukprot:6418560-Lingulodinium_polyedra.AAC.1
MASPQYPRQVCFGWEATAEHAPQRWRPARAIALWDSAQVPRGAALSGPEASSTGSLDQTSRACRQQDR